jgi:multidrug efflux pump
MSLGSLALALIFAILGGVLGLFSPASGILLTVAAIFALFGGIMVVVHSLEAIFRGGKTSIIAGLILGIFNAVILMIVSISQPVATGVWIALLAVPALLIVLGSFGLFRSSDKHLILTDNRALMLNSVMGTLIAIFAIFSIAPTGVEFFPETDPNRIIIELEGPIGMNVDASNEISHNVQQRIYDLIEEDPNVKGNVESIQTNVGVAGDPFFGGGGQSPELSRLTINLVDFGDRIEPSAMTITKLREVIRDIPDIIVNIDGEEMGPPTGAPVNIEVSGEDFDEIIRITREITQILVEASTTQRVQGLVDVRNNVSGGLPEYRIRVDYESASRFGLNMADIAQTIRIANNGLEASKWRDGEDEYDIMVRLRPEDRQNLESLNNLNIRTAMGGSTPLVSVASFEEGSGLGNITRLNLQRTATIEGMAAPGFSGPEVLMDVQELLTDYRENLPAGYSIEYTGESEDQEEAFGFLTTALMVGFALIFLVMLVKFNSIISPLIIMTAVGLSLIGVYYWD